MHAGRAHPTIWVALVLLLAACGAPAADPTATTGTGLGTGPTVASLGTGPAGTATPTVDSTPSGAAAGSGPETVTTGAGPASAITSAPSADGSSDKARPTLPASVPVTLSVPSIGIDSPLVELGRNDDGTVEVPSLDDPEAKPGWYRESPTPGSLGPAIILGHVDSRRFGPGVFFDLPRLRPGDGIDVTRADGSVARFAVDSVREVAKNNFPTLEVYGNLDHAGLRLITCGGEFDSAAGSYESNVIVFASLIGPG